VLLQELGKFLVRASSLLADLHQLLIPVTVRLGRSCHASHGHTTATCACMPGRCASFLPFSECISLLLQMATAPQAIEFFMTLFCNTSRIVLLMERVPWRLVVQVCVAHTTTHTRARAHTHTHTHTHKAMLQTVLAALLASTISPCIRALLPHA
jgi:hypothetical protein